MNIDGFLARLKRLKRRRKVVFEATPNLRVANSDVCPIMFVAGIREPSELPIAISRLKLGSPSASAIIAAADPCCGIGSKREARTRKLLLEACGIELK